MVTLSDADRRIITQARELAALGSASAVRQRFGGTGASAATAGVAYVEAFREAQHLLTELAALAEPLPAQRLRLADGVPEPGPASELAARTGGVRG